MKMMTWMKFKLALVLGTAVLLTGGIVGVALSSDKTQRPPGDIVVFFKQAISAPPDVESFVAGQRDLRPQDYVALITKLQGPAAASHITGDRGAMRFYSGARAGTNYFLRSFVNSNSPYVPNENGFISGHAGTTSYEFSKNSISYGFGSNAITGGVRALLGMVRQVLDMGVGEMNPDTVVWNGNEFSAQTDYGATRYGELELSNNLPSSLKIGMGGNFLNSPPYRTIQYIYPDPPTALGGFPCKIIMSGETEEGLKPSMEIVLQSIHLAARPIHVEFFSPDKFKTAAILLTNIYTDAGLFVYRKDGKMVLISNQNGKTVAIPRSPFQK